MKKPSVNRGWYGDDKVEMASDDKAAASAADYDALGVNNDGEGDGDSKERSSFDEKEPAKGLAGEVMISSSAKQTLDVWDDEISEVVLLPQEKAEMRRKADLTDVRRRLLQSHHESEDTHRIWMRRFSTSLKVSKITQSLSSDWEKSCERETKRNIR